MRPEPVAIDWLPAGGQVPHAPSLPGAYWLGVAGETWEREAALALRRAVFCTEQGLFDGSDEDAEDRHAELLVALAGSCGMPDQVVGTVRIVEHRPGCWQGSRLAVAPAWRGTSGVGSALIRLAVGTARARGARRFVACVQPQNRALFERLGWQAEGGVEVQGRPHVRMRADLRLHPPLAALPRLRTALRQAA